MIRVTAAVCRALEQCNELSSSIVQGMESHKIIFFTSKQGGNRKKCVAPPDSDELLQIFGVFRHRNLKVIFDIAIN